MPISPLTVLSLYMRPLKNLFLQQAIYNIVHNVICKINAGSG